ncbi:MAG TPA: efflux RND transporter periplasmic adaptor subunit [Polyangiaceae bacterium]|nr:efflux RND transporter periplasmic adaptor subunit [Polyangiaceae bacterium]
MTGHGHILGAIATGTLTIALAGGFMTWRAAKHVNQSPLTSAPASVSFVRAAAATFRDTRSYVGAIEPWQEANVGPQYISAYVETVLVRPGDVVARGAVIATLDCSSPRSSTQIAAMLARSLDSRQRALADEAARVQSLLDGGFVAINDSEKKQAQSDSEHAELRAAQARLAAAALDVNDCVLKAPFDGEIATRTIDPGAFVHPGNALVSVVDRDTVRVVADAPERDFDALRPGVIAAIDAISNGAHIDAPISRRAPKADPSTRTVHFEIDIPDKSRSLPVASTGLIHVEVGAPRPSTSLPLHAAMVSQHKARIFVLDGDIARAKDVGVLGEAAGVLFVDPAQLPADARVVVEGRALLHDGDHVVAKPEPPAPASNEPEDAGRGGGSGRPL